MRLRKRNNRGEEWKGRSRKNVRRVRRDIQPVMNLMSFSDKLSKTEGGDRAQRDEFCCIVLLCSFGNSISFWCVWCVCVCVMGALCVFQHEICCMFPMWCVAYKPWWPFPKNKRTVFVSTIRKRECYAFSFSLCVCISLGLWKWVAKSD